jgi:hypothetical protein
MIWKMVFAAAGLAFCSTLAHADPDTLQPITFASVRADLKKSLTKMSVREDVVPVGCLDGGKDKRTVCNFKIGAVLGVMVESKKGKKDVVAITMICSGTQGAADAAMCLLGYNALIAATTPELNGDARGKILSTLMSGLDVGNEISIATEERKCAAKVPWAVVSRHSCRRRRGLNAPRRRDVAALMRYFGSGLPE